MKSETTTEQCLDNSNYNDDAPLTEKTEDTITCWKCGEVFDEPVYSFSIKLKEGYGVDDIELDMCDAFEIEDGEILINCLETSDDIEEDIKNFIKEFGLGDIYESYEQNEWCPHCLNSVN